MKKLFEILAFIALLTISCTKEMVSSGENEKEQTPVGEKQ